VRQTGYRGRASSYFRQRALGVHVVLQSLSFGFFFLGGGVEVTTDSLVETPKSESQS
jgi:hypothetical protein